MTGSYDLNPIIDQNDLEVFHQIDEQVEKSLITGNVLSILRFGHGLRRTMQVQGIAMAKLLSMVEKNWSLYTQAGVDEDFYAVIYAELGYAHETVKKYIGVWRDVMENESVPEEVKQKILKGMPIQTLLLLPAAAKEGSLNWNDIADAATHAEVVEAVRKARGQQTSSKTRIVITMNGTTGALQAKREGEKPYNIGHLAVPYESDTAEEAIERILKQSGITEVF
jgi:hypothetical protein